MKKVLSIILIFSILFVLSATPVFSAKYDAEKNDTQFFAAMGIFPATAEEDTVLTRIQLAEIFYNIVFSYQSESGKSWGEYDFQDVPLESKHLASTVASLGAMRGYSSDIFGPNDPVTYAQTVKAIVSFLGYDIQADLLGGFPSGYFAQASRLQILPAGNYPGDYQATYGTVAAILKKAINKDIAIWNNSTSDGTATQDVLEGTDYIKYYTTIFV